MSAKRFNELPEETQQFLADLREEDVKLLVEGIDFMRSIRTVGRFFRWVIVGAFGLVVGAAALWKAVQELMAWKIGR